MDKSETKELKYWSFVMLLSYVPTIGFHFLIRPMWFKGTDSFTCATLLELLFTIVILPIYLIAANYFLAKKYDKASELFIINGIMILTCIFISTHLHFKNWADSIGSYSPDNETEGVMDFERTVGIIISLIGLIIVYFRIRSKNKSGNKENID